MHAIEELRRTLDEHAAAGRTAPLGGFAALRIAAPPLHGAAISQPGLFSGNCDSLALSELRCGTDPGIVLAVLTGNFKDEGSAVAAGAGAVRVLASFAAQLLSEADLAPALRRAALEAHDEVLRLSLVNLGDHEFGTAIGARTSLRGIGSSMTAVAVRPHRLHGVHIGEGRAYLLRDGQAKRLTLDHTFAHSKAYRDAVRTGELPEIEHANLIVTQVLGLMDAQLRIDAFRVDLRAGDRVVVGNFALTDEIAQAACECGGDAAAMSATLAERMTEDFPASPATVGAIVSEAE